MPLCVLVGAFNLVEERSGMGCDGGGEFLMLLWVLILFAYLPRE
jgi:hypothetical protein